MGKGVSYHNQILHKLLSYEKCSGPESKIIIFFYFHKTKDQFI